MMVFTSSHSPQIEVAGAAGIDITLRNAPNWIGQTGHDGFTPDSLHFIECPVECGLGGNGAASAFVLGTFGVQVELNAPIGLDSFGDLIRGWLKEANVICNSPPAESTSVSITAATSEGRRLGTVRYPGPRVQWELSAQKPRINWLLLVVHSQVVYEELEAVRETLKTSRQSGVTTVLDSGIGWNEIAEQRDIYGLWSNADLLIGTFDELSQWTEKNTPESIAHEVFSHGVGTLIIKMGADGVSYATCTDCLKHQYPCHVGTPNLSIGAGDAFDGALVAHLSFGQTLESAVRSAQQVAATVVAEGRGVLGWRQANCVHQRGGNRSNDDGVLGLGRDYR